MQKISVVVITKNAESKVGKCLESVKWADEIIVVDGGSEDSTVNIARGFGAKVINHKFTGSFADDRNIGMEAARNRWVLQLDADEVATEAFRKKAEETLSAEGAAVVYKFRRKNVFLGHSMDFGGFHHYIPNLVNKERVRFEGVVHEVPKYDGEIGVIEADIEHHPFDSISQFVDRQNRYTDIAAREMLKKDGVLPEREIRRMLVRHSFRIFWKSYFKKRGYKDGFYGLIFAVLFAFINFIKWSKYWELVRKK